MMTHSRHNAKLQQGFTIIELMIATSILAVILVIVTSLMIGIGNLYDKGINQARVQDDVRSITDQLSSDIKLNNSTIAYGTGTISAPDATGSDHTLPVASICIGGSVRYTYILGYKIGAAESIDASVPTVNHVLWRDDDTDNSDLATLATTGCPPINLQSVNSSSDPSGTELITDNSRLTAFSVNSLSSSSYMIDVGAAYGDIDLLNLDLANPINTTCKGSTGDQFCATAYLSTTVTQRL